MTAIPADKAGEFLCPFLPYSRALTAEEIEEAGALHGARAKYLSQPTFGRCAGPHCMAWRWDEADVEREETKTDQPPSGDGWLFCYRRHDGWPWARPRTPTHGRCGRVP